MKISDLVLFKVGFAHDRLIKAFSPGIHSTNVSVPTSHELSVAWSPVKTGPNGGLILALILIVDTIGISARFMLLKLVVVVMSPALPPSVPS